MQVHRAFADIDAVRTALTHFHATHQRYPTTTEGLSALTPRFLRRLAQDPWGNAYVYRAVKSESYALYSVGIDGQDEGGLGNDVTTRGKKYANPAYCVYGAVSPRRILACAILSLLMASMLAGLARGVAMVWKNLI